MTMPVEEGGCDSDLSRAAMERVIRHRGTTSGVRTEYGDRGGSQKSLSKRPLLLSQSS